MNYGKVLTPGAQAHALGCVFPIKVEQYLVIHLTCMCLQPFGASSSHPKLFSGRPGGSWQAFCIMVKVDVRLCDVSDVGWLVPRGYK